MCYAAIEMSQHYGVKCKKCGVAIALGDRDPSDRAKMPYYAPPLEPIRCPSCKAKHVYTSNDVIEFDAKDLL